MWVFCSLESKVHFAPFWDGCLSNMTLCPTVVKLAWIYNSKTLNFKHTKKNEVPTSFWPWDGCFILLFMSHMNWNLLWNILRWRFTMYNSSKKFPKRFPHWIINNVNKCQYLNIFWNLISDDKCYLEVWLNRHMISCETEISHLDNYLGLFAITNIQLTLYCCDSP